MVLASAHDEPRLSEILTAARERGIKVEEAGRERLDDIAHSDSHQGVVAYVGRRRYWDLPDLLADLKSEPAPMLLVLDGIQDPQNLGSISRTAEAAGVAGVLIPRHRSAEVTPAVAKASAGAVEHLRIAMVGSLAQAIDRLKQEGYWTIGLAGAKSFSNQTVAGVQNLMGGGFLGVLALVAILFGSVTGTAASCRRRLA